MSYAQTNYSQSLGNGPYTIAQAGCFVTAFANLLERFGEGIDPAGLNQYFINHGSYSHDPSEPAGTADNVAWGTVSAYDGQIATTGIGGAGWPPSNDAIVKFVYKSTRTGATVTHFCLVADHAAGTIVDSWDGVTKASPYGTPVAWATYERHAVQVVTPPAPAETPAFTVQGIPEVTKELKIDAKLWDMNQRSWPAMVNNPVGSAAKDTKFQTVAIAHHILGGSYYLPVGSTTQGYNIVDTEDPEPTPAPIDIVIPAPAATPTPSEPVVPKIYTENTVEGVEFTALNPDMKKMYIVKPGGTEKWNFKDVKVWSGFRSVKHYNYGDAIFISGTAYHEALNARYEVDSNDWNGFAANGQPNNWYGFNKVDLSETRPPEIKDPEPAPIVSETAPAVTPDVAPATTVVTTPAATTAPIDWQTTYRPYQAAQKYIATRKLAVKDISGSQSDEYLPMYNPNTTPEQGVVRAFGTVRKDGIEYYRLRTNNDPNFAYWYCVPVLDPATQTANLLPYPTPAATSNVLEVFGTSIEKMLRAILPSWFDKNKK